MGHVIGARSDQPLVIEWLRLGQAVGLTLLDAEIPQPKTKGKTMKTMRSGRILLMTALTIGSITTTTATARAVEDGTPCTLEVDLVASPGISTQESSGRVTSYGETGTISCDGKVNGKQTTGPGTLGWEGRYGTQGGDTCSSGGEGDGVWSFTVPTSGGTEHVDQAVTLTYGPLRGGVFAVEFRSERFSGTGEVTPLEGDCVTKPITKVHFKGEGVLRGSA